jgi:hypothetical protein
MTVMFDHDVTDGAPVARFIGYLRKLMEAGYGINELGQVDRFSVLSKDSDKNIPSGLSAKVMKP